MVEVGANEAEQHLESTRAACAFEETRFYLSGKIVQGVSKVEGRRFVECDGFLDALSKRELPPGNAGGSFQAVKVMIVTSHEDFT